VLGRDRNARDERSSSPSHDRRRLRSYDIAAAHADPFDRLVLAQAIAEPLYLLSTHESLAEYGGEFVMIVE
jgi:PIN domain nuclease of toxin-antitoxin system